MKWIAVGVGALVLGALLGTALPVSAQSAPEIPLVIEKNRFQPDVIKVKPGHSSLILGIVYAYLEKVGARDGFRFVTWGGTVGLLLSVTMGIAVTFLSGPLLDLGPDIITVVVIFAAVGLLTWHAWWMQQHARLMKGQVQHRIDEARASNRLWVVGLIGFAGVFREGAETYVCQWW